MASITLPRLLSTYEPTRASLHAYAKAVGAVARAHAIPHPKWWHVSLEVRPEGLASDPIPLPDGGAMAITIDPGNHEIRLRSSHGTDHRIDLSANPTATEVGDSLIAVASRLGLDDRYERDRFEDDAPREYDVAAAGAYFDSFVAVDTVFNRRRVTLGERVGPVQLWPHGFDVSFEWFGTKTVASEGEPAPAQINLGFYPGGDQPYFYSSPWPFDTGLTGTALPDGAQWNTEGWQGASLRYEVARTAPDPARAISDFAAAVFDLARPALEAP